MLALMIRRISPLSFTITKFLQSMMNSSNCRIMDSRFPKVVFTLAVLIFVACMQCWQAVTKIVPYVGLVGTRDLVDNYSKHILDSYNGSIQPLWSCSGQPDESASDTTNNKLIFVHVFKTAGSTFRRFLDLYGQKCDKAVSLIIACSDVSVTSLSSSSSADNSTLWRDRNTGKPCINKQTRTREKEIVVEGKDMKGTDLQQYNVDILGGHLPIGLDEHWIIEDNDHDPETTVNAQYLTFFREPLAKFVSGRVFVHKKQHWTHEQAVEAIKQHVLRARSRGKYYNGYTKYLLTPQQKELPHSHEESVRLIQENLVRFNPIVGIVELMGESVALIQSVIDTDLELSESLRQLDTSQTAVENHGNSTETKMMVRNKSALSTTAIVESLRDDKECFALLQEYLKYEYELYDFARQLHKKQVDRMKEQYGDKYMDSF